MVGKKKGDTDKRRGGESSRPKVWQLVVGLAVVTTGTVLMMGALGGWFKDRRVKVDADYICGENCRSGFMEMSVGLYDEMMMQKRSFVVFVDQSGCSTADMLRGFVKDYAKENGFRAFRMMFAEVMESSLHDYVKYYPSVAMISRGEVVAWLDAESDADAKYYNNYDDFASWMNQHLTK